MPELGCLEDRLLNGSLESWTGIFISRLSHFELYPLIYPPFASCSLLGSVSVRPAFFLRNHLRAYGSGAKRQRRKFESKQGDVAHSKERPSQYRLLTLSA
jgi:hypothetical protein